MHSETVERAEQGGTNILPIPPPLKFPYPRPSTATSSTPSSVHLNALKSINSASSARSPTCWNQNPSEIAPSISAIKPRPSLPTTKFLTERPVAIPRGSVFHMKRSQTGNAPTASNNATWDSDSSSSSSSSGEENLVSRPHRRPTKAKAQEHGLNASAAKNLAGRGDSHKHPFSRFAVGKDGYKTKGKVSKKDGRLSISIKETANSGYLAKALGATLHRHLGRDGNEKDDEYPARKPLNVEDAPSQPGIARIRSTISAASTYDRASIPKLNIVVMVIGSRGDIQPFLKLGKLLKEGHGHRVRIATHPAFKTFVEMDSGLEFFSVGGDPAELMAFMVKNPGLIPSISTVRAGDIGRKRDSMFEMFQGFWRACINATDDETDILNRKMMGDKHPFVADAIIANPPCFAHVHCAERLGIPLHLMFTFPYTPTQQFPHPLANIKKSNVDPGYTNFMSYPLVEMMTWQGLGDLVNRFRVKTLGLEPVSTLWAPGQLFRLKVPYTYMWSPGLVPKPSDWGPEIDIVGFVFLDLASSFEPPEALSKFLDAGEPPVYIGFGSIVVEDPDKFTSLIFEAVKRAGIRALVSKGWGGLGSEGNTPENVFMLENTPHDWLFPRVSAVVHHGGAGTTAIGLKCGKPTMIVPFFGDQPFWGSMVAKAGAGAHESIPYKRLTAENMAEGIKKCLSLEAKAHAEKLAACIAEEGDGAANAVKSFHRSLPLRGKHSMRCNVLDDYVAVWTLKNTKVRLSALAANILVEKKKLQWHELRLIRHYEWNDFEGPGEPFTGGGAALLTTAGGVAKGIAGMPLRWAKSIKKHEKHEQKKKQRRDNANGNATTNGDLPKMKKHTKSHASVRAVDIDDAFTNDVLFSRASTASEDHFVQDLANDAGAGLTETGEALAKAPMDLSLAIAQGFHNAPRLYGDHTVRRPVRISGIRSGLKAAGEEFAFGIYDGWTGLIIQPYQGGKQEGPLGFVKGVGKGFGGFVLKDLAAIIGPFSYTLKGIHKELVKGKQPTRYIRKARIIQGEKDIRALDDSGKGTVLRSVYKGWHIILEVRRNFIATKNTGIGGRLRLYREKKKWAEYGAFENVEQAKMALDAKKEGIELEEVLGQRRRQIKKAEEPRKSTMSRAQSKGKGGVGSAGKEGHGMNGEIAETNGHRRQ